MSDTPLTDDYVAKLLTEDALHVSREISRRSALAPKPNTRFLKNMIRDADGHNAALRRREEHEARDRERQRNHDNRRAGRSDAADSGRLTPPEHDRNGSKFEHRSKRQRMEDGRHRSGHDRERHEGRERHRKSRRSRSRSRSGERARHRRRGRDEDLGNKSTRRYHGSRRQRSRSRSPDRAHHAHRERHERRRSRSANRGRERESDSDPLEDLIGPAPPSATTVEAPVVRGRGRRTFASNAMDRRFASDYDPSVEEEGNADAQKDDWADALEALRARQRWQQIGAQRMRDAGFGEEAVKKWEKGKGPMAGDEGDVADVKWSKKGQDREWDHGKVLTDEGVSTLASWGRLKDT